MTLQRFFRYYMTIQIQFRNVLSRSIFTIYCSITVFFYASIRAYMYVCTKENHEERTRFPRDLTETQLDDTQRYELMGT